MEKIWGLNGVIFAAPVCDLISIVVSIMFVWAELKMINQNIKSTKKVVSVK
jgi:hypothetical protein